MHGNEKAKLEYESLKKSIEDDFGYGLVSLKEDRNGDWAALKASHGVK
ncbi:MAG: hypothetical protein IT462_13390 [Planctomycetes bacterium]|nr:hypothetical protein [Planctomycetota bacterium]